MHLKSTVHAYSLVHVFYLYLFNWRSECSHSQVIKIEICDRYMFGTCESYWACAKKVIAKAMTFDGQRSSCRSVESGEDWSVSVLRKR